MKLKRKLLPLLGNLMKGRTRSLRMRIKDITTDKDDVKMVLMEAGMKKRTEVTM